MKPLCLSVSLIKVSREHPKPREMEVVPFKKMDGDPQRCDLKFTFHGTNIILIEIFKRNLPQCKIDDLT